VLTTILFERRPAFSLPVVDLVNGKASPLEELFDVVLAHDVAFSKAERQPREQLARNPPFEPAQHGKRQQGGERGKNCRIEKADPVDNSAAEEAAVVNPRTVKKPCLNTTPAPIKPIPVMMPCAMRLGLVLKLLSAAMPSQLGW